MNKLSLVILALISAACEQTATEIVQQERIELSVSASGELESQSTAIIAPPSVARMWEYQIKFLLAENTQVSKGQLLVSFDDKQVADRLVEKQAELARAQQELENNVIKATATEKELVLKLAEQQMEYDKAQRKANIIDHSRSDNERRKSIIDFTIAENDLFLAKEKLTFHRDNKQLNHKLANSKVDRITAKVNDLERDIERLKVKAPSNGMVIYKTNFQGEKPAVGENIRFGQPIIEIAVIEKMQLKVQIDEPDSGKVKIGQQVKVTLDSTKEHVYSGEIVSLGRVFREKSYQDKRKIFDAIIAFDKTDPAIMRPGMSARVKIITTVLDNALTISSSAVKNLAGENVVTFVGSFNNSQQAIKIEHVIGNKVVIGQGLSSGDEVAL
jgi:HlyD family secretion protein